MGIEDVANGQGGVLVEHVTYERGDTAVCSSSLPVLCAALVQCSHYAKLGLDYLRIAP